MNKAWDRWLLFAWGWFGLGWGLEELGSVMRIIGV
jgi:hypothetical protein